MNKIAAILLRFMAAKVYDLWLENELDDLAIGWALRAAADEYDP